MRGDTAKQLSEKFGKILQNRQSIVFNRNDTSITKSKQLDIAIPINKISSLSSGEFVGIIADNPDRKIELKAFRAEIINDHEAFNREQTGYKELHIFSRVEPSDVPNRYLQVKRDVSMIIQTEIERMLHIPELAALIIFKQKVIIQCSIPVEAFPG